MATITTVIPVFNGAQYILETLDSLAAQTRRPDRVVVVDDCSTDKTEQIVRNYKKLECEWFTNERNLGLFPNHNSALRFAAETKFFHILHSNDLISPRFFEKLIPLIEKAPEQAMAFSGHVFIRDDGSPTQQIGRVPGKDAHELSVRQFLDMQADLKSIQLHSAVLKTDFKNMPVQFRTDLPQLGDVIFHAQFATHCSQIWADPEVLCQVRIHAGSATNRNMLNINAWVLDEWRAMQMVLDIMREKHMSSTFRCLKSRLLFAARSQVKVQTVKSRYPEYAQEIVKEAKKRTGAIAWSTGGAIVALRDFLIPKADATKERLK
jgi:glycosyltransferase involved in cell wall biosynthesis